VLAGDWQPDRTALTTTNEGGIDALDLDWRLGVRATGLDLGQRTVELAPSGAAPTGTAAAPDLQWLPFDGLVIATGATPRLLPVATEPPGADADADAGPAARPGQLHGLAGIHVLRSLDDCLALRADLDASPHRVVVVGAGFIGAEVAATCRTRGLEVTLLEALPVPLERAVGPEIGALMADVHRDHGVDVRLGVGVAGFEGGRGSGGGGGTDERRVEGVRLADGSFVAADVVVVGVGVEPNCAWLQGSGLLLDNGVVCDASGLAAPGVVAAGDVARWPSPRFGRLLRIEHWDNAITMAEHVARRLLAGAGTSEPEPAPDPYDPVPWFWSDQYDRKIQLAGLGAGADEMVLVDGSFEERRFAVLYRHGNRLGGVLAMNRPRQVVRFRALIERGASWEEALEVAREA
jgi:3-phenylpropionate/trans-cinnamate dioxygenase ferredoxin reductase subunit